MILEEMNLKDFRCFYGESVVRFSMEESRNVTLIYAENGVGKTTLLNALLWCFYGDTTERFEKREDILNYDAKREGRTTASVEVVFEHEGNTYVAKRFSVVGAFANGSREFMVHRIDKGSHVDIPSADTFINSVIPRDMASHFLFDGEHAEIFLGEKRSGAIKGAVRDILGCSLVEMVIEDLSAVSGQFRRQIPTTSATALIAELSSRLDALTEQAEKSEGEVARLEKERETTETQIRDIEEKLRNSAAAKDLQRTRDQLNEQLKRAEKRRKEATDVVYRWLGDNGRYVVSKKITDQTFAFLDDKEHRGRIPSPYNEEFVKDILKDETCICGAHLMPGSEAAARVAGLLNKAANQTMRDRIAKVRGRLSSLRAGRIKAPVLLMKAKEAVASANADCALAESHLAEISEKLKGIDIEGIDARERRRGELREAISQIDRTVGRLKSHAEETARDRVRFDKEINDLAQRDKQTAIYATRRTLCESIKDALEKDLRVEEDAAKKLLRSEIKGVLAATTHKVFTLKMSDDYVISLVNDAGQALPKSSGENQLLGLAFTAALVKFAKYRKSARDYRLLPGTIAPLVLDSPFGQLDEAYRETTAQFIPKMARQVVLLISKSQGSKEVLDALNDRVGAEYVLVRHNREAPGERKPESRYLKGKEFKTAVFNSNFDGTQVMEVATR
jgi:DNA sulfur modification protein DndD